jgi:ribosome-associated toxin RatA of RatAB toxin-antitoxin module
MRASAYRLSRITRNAGAVYSVLIASVKIRRAVPYVFASLAGVALFVTAIGYALPQNHVAAKDALLPAGPQELFERITDVARYPEWRRDVSAVEVVSREPLTWRERSGGDTITYEVVERTAPSRLVVRIADPELPFGGTWTYDLRAEGQGTRLTITERGEVYNPVFRFMSRFVFGHAASIETMLEALGDR